MKWKEIANNVHQAGNDATEASEIGPSYRWGEEKAEATELNQWTIDRMYDLLGTAVANANIAMNKLRKHTTYYKEQPNDNQTERS